MRLQDLVIRGKEKEFYEIGFAQGKEECEKNLKDRNKLFEKLNSQFTMWEMWNKKELPAYTFMIGFGNAFKRELRSYREKFYKPNKE